MNENKLKLKDSRKFVEHYKIDINKENILYNDGEYYLGGFIPIPIKNKEFGYLCVTEKRIMFRNSPFRTKNEKYFEIPFDKVLWDETYLGKQEDLDYKNKMAATTYFSTGIPISSYSRQMDCLKITFKDENNVKQTPIFNIQDKHMKKFCEIFYEILKRYSEKNKKDSNSNKKEENLLKRDQNPLKILKIRYAQGKITKEEYLEMKKELEK